ncbi:hypothetical protein CKA32_002258 [Geitlerinema sp. FC II]|nr:hypothetical protein CKA32_002258 [Geitlerinema sp. FC II]
MAIDPFADLCYCATDCSAIDKRYGIRISTLRLRSDSNTGLARVHLSFAKT